MFDLKVASNLIKSGSRASQYYGDKQRGELGGSIVSKYLEIALSVDIISLQHHIKRLNVNQV